MPNATKCENDPHDDLTAYLAVKLSVQPMFTERQGQLFLVCCVITEAYKQTSIISSNFNI